MPWKWAKGAKLIARLWDLVHDGLKEWRAERRIEGDIHAAETALKEAKTAAESCLVNSFTARTPVVMADGSRKPIAKVKVGDKVRATDPETGQTASRPVTARIVHGGPHRMVTLTLADHSTLTATDRHPIWDASAHAFVYAADLRAGETLLRPDGSAIRLAAVRIVPESLTVYNLTIDGIHTYYAGTTPVLVHNSCLYRFGTTPESAESLAAQAAKAEDSGFPHDVSVRSATNRTDASMATRESVEENFDVVKTGPRP